MGDEMLIGLLLGYGANNARLFSESQQGKDVYSYIEWGEEIDKQMLERLSLKTHLWGVLWETEAEEVAALLYPTFIADPHSEETQQLKARYIKEREKIIAFYKDQNFLEATLSLLL